MANYSYTLTTDFISVNVRPEYLEFESTPLDNHYAWGYHVKIENKGKEAVQLITRYWHITDGKGLVQEVNGHGVVGLQPIIEPNGKFEYSSSVALTTPSGMMHGHYELKTSDNRLFKALIPVFSLDSYEQIRMPN